MTSRPSSPAGGPARFRPRLHARAPVALAAMVIAAACLVVVWTVYPNNPPIYDGLPLGSPPYRYLVPPPNRAGTAPPTSVTKTFPVAGTPYGFQLQTLEPDPQASVLIPLASLSLPAGAARVTVSLAPVLPSESAPLGTILDGNVYRLSLVAEGQPVPLRQGRTVRVTLRHTGSPGRPALAVLQSRGWKRLPSVEEAVGTSTGDSPDLGDLVLLVSTRSRGGIGGPLISAFVVAGVLGVMAAVLVVLRRRRTK